MIATRLAPALVLVLSAPALAHPADLVVARLAPVGPGGAGLVERLTVTPETLLRLAPIDADGDGALSPSELEDGAAAVAAGVWDEAPLESPAGPCRRSAEAAALVEGAVELEAVFHCPQGELTQEFKLLRVLPPSYRLELWGPGDEVPAFLQGPGRLPVGRPVPAAPGEALRRGLERGLARSLALDALAALACLGLAFHRWPRALAGLGALLLGLGLGSLAPGGGPWPVAGLAVAGALLARLEGEVPLALAGAVGLGLGLRDGGGPAPDPLGLALASALVAAVALPGFVALGRLLRRRGPWGPRVRWLAAAAVAFGLGLRLGP